MPPLTMTATHMNIGVVVRWAMSSANAVSPYLTVEYVVF